MSHPSMDSVSLMTSSVLCMQFLTLSLSLFSLLYFCLFLLLQLLLPVLTKKLSDMKLRAIQRLLGYEVEWLDLLDIACHPFSRPVRGAVCLAMHVTWNAKWNRSLLARSKLFVLFKSMMLWPVIR